MANFKLGANAITAAYLGTQGICIINDGADTVFDAACGAQFTVTHTVNNSIGGTTNGYTISTSPGTTFTGEPGDPYSFTTTVSLNGGYRWQGGTVPTISPAQPITGVVGSANSTVTTTISGGTVELIPVGDVTVTYTISTSAITVQSGGFTLTNDFDVSPKSGPPPLSYTFGTSIAPQAGSEWVGSAPAAVSVSGSTSSSIPVALAFANATIRETTYTVTQTLTNDVQGPSAGYNLTWDGTANYNSSGTRSESGTLGQSYTFSASSLSVNSGYEETSALSLSGGGVVNGTFGTGPTSYQTTASGTVALTTPNAVVLGSLGTCANDACINPGVSSTWYYFNSLQNAILWSNPDGLTGSNPSNGYYNRGSVALLYSGGVSQATVSCYSSVSYIALGDGGNSVTACNDTLSDFFYVTGSTNPQAMNGVWNTSDGCTGAGAQYYSDGNSWNQTNSGGLVINVGTC